MTVTARRRSIFAAEYRITTAGLLTIIAMIAFEAMAVGPALPTAARELHSVGAYGWLFTIPLATSVVGMVIAGQLSDSRGPRLPLTAGITAFLIGLAVAGSAQSVVQLVLARGVQGIGVGLSITAVYVVIGECYDDELRPAVFAATSSAWVVPSLVGPVLSGLITENLGWRWVFLGLVPFVLVGSLLLVPVLGTLHRPALSAPRDLRRIGRAVAVAAGVSGIEAGGQHLHVWSAPVLLAALGAVAWGITALVPAGTFRAAPGVAAPVAIRGLMSGAFFGIEAGVPLMLTVQHGFRPVAAGFPLTFAGLSWALGSWWAGRTPGDDDVQRLRLARAGFALVASAALIIALVSQHGVAPWPVYVAWALAGAGAGLTMSGASVLLLRHTTDADRGGDSAALQLADTTSAALTTGLAGVLIASAAAGRMSYGLAFGVLDAVMCAVAILGTAAARGTAAASP